MKDLEDKILALEDDGSIAEWFQGRWDATDISTADLKAYVRECRELREAAEDVLEVSAGKYTYADAGKAMQNLRDIIEDQGHSRQPDSPPAPLGQVTSETGS